MNFQNDKLYIQHAYMVVESWDLINLPLEGDEKMQRKRLRRSCS
jgi:hypothetical protein